MKADEDVPSCRICGCTELEPCVGGCAWVPDPEGRGDLCSSCLHLAKVEVDVDLQARIPEKIAADLIEFGGVLRCRCGEERGLSKVQMAQYFREGWPEHCGMTMVWVTQRQLETEAAPR